MGKGVQRLPISTRHGIATRYQTSPKTNIKPSQWILTLTRCCTENCEFCAVDALYCPTIADIRHRSQMEQQSGRELTPDQWCSVAAKLLQIDPASEFDLSGGDCLSLPWVPHQLIPFILERVKSRKQVSVTATATSLRLWLNEARVLAPEKRPGSVHVTFDGYRPYSFENLRLASLVSDLGMELHAECPLTNENCSVEKVNEIYYALQNSSVREILLMRFFPVGRGTENAWRQFEPPAEMYRAAISEFKRLATLNEGGPVIKVQCALKKFEYQEGGVPCKMGNSTWCVMPNGVLLICPWAYGLNGLPIDDAFVAGSILHNDFSEFRSKAHVFREALRQKYPRECRIQALVERFKHPLTTQIHGARCH